ncbi:MAG: hypothetical protein ACI89X_001341 [Planctomycetota bacterium]|jgi:hypothetical protein
MHNHKSFWFDLGGKIGPAIFSATLVGCLLSSRLEILHGILLGTGLLLIYLEHRATYHRDNTA